MNPPTPPQRPLLTLKICKCKISAGYFRFILCPEAEFMNVMYNHVEVSGHNLESSQTYGFNMKFLNHREGGMVFYQVFLLSHLQKL
jgi:hypothetical protein